ncbi:MAG: type IV pilus assembly protein PilW [Arenicella sp.]|jgi:type IV pilus assembly protein PilW
MANDTSNTSNDQQGYTLVELLVAITLGLLLSAAVVQSYMATRQTSRITEGVSRIQENARFGLHFLTTDIRDAGYSGCIGRIRNKLNGDPSNFLSFKAPVQGWEYTGTASGDSGDNAFELSGIPLIVPAEGAAWAQASGGSSANLPTTLIGRVVAGSDVIYFKNFAELDLTIKNHDDSSTPIVVQSPHGLEDQSILLVGNCSEAELFQHLSNGDGDQISITASEGNGHNDPGNRHTGSTKSWSRDYDYNDTLFEFKQTYFYIGEGPSGLPSLFRYSSSLPFSAETTEFVAANLEELVEGVETMQLLYGEDVTGDDSPNRYVSAHQISDWNAIVSVRVGLLIMSPNAAAGQDQSEALGTAYSLLDGIEFTHAIDDLTLRYAANSTIKLRNRGLDDNLAYSICDTVDEDESEADNGIDTCSTAAVGGGGMGGGKQ